MIPRDDVDATWQAWYDENGHRFRYSPVGMEETDTRGARTFILTGITPRIRFILYPDGSGGDMYVLSQDNEIWDYLLWLDNPAGEPKHDMIANTLEPFLQWSNALNMVDRIDLIGTADQGARVARLVSPPGSQRNRVAFVYDWKAKTFRSSLNSNEIPPWVHFEAIAVHL